MHGNTESHDPSMDAFLIGQPGGYDTTRLLPPRFKMPLPHFARFIDRLVLVSATECRMSTSQADDRRKPIRGLQAERTRAQICPPGLRDLRGVIVLTAHPSPILLGPAHRATCWPTSPRLGRILSLPDAPSPTAYARRTRPIQAPSHRSLPRPILATPPEPIRGFRGLRGQPCDAQRRHSELSANPSAPPSSLRASGGLRLGPGCREACGASHARPGTKPSTAPVGAGEGVLARSRGVADQASRMQPVRTTLLVAALEEKGAGGAGTPAIYALHNSTGAQPLQLCTGVAFELWRPQGLTRYRSYTS
ncbi:hypothetical protein VTO73DRAFT_1689 [Trametes versicolor]